jgi:peptide/nickel transport system substrate-binding protein
LSAHAGASAASAPLPPRWRRALPGLALAASAVAALAGCARESAELPPGVLVVSQEQTGSWVRNFNPLTTAAAARWPTLAGVYEPLFVFNSVRSEQVPWLATAYEWREGNRVLRVTTREGVRWSDGQPFSARDVSFTFQLLKRHAALDRRGVWGFLSGVRATDARTVEFAFQRVFIPGFDEVAAQLIVPEHVWRDVEDPVTFANEQPVATGPFTEVRLFRPQVYELGRNPHYWQPGRPALEGLRFPAYPSNDRANLALVFDEVEWAGNFIPAIDRVFVGRNPEHHAYWFPLTAGVVYLYANTTRAPFGDARVRKALSMALDRGLMVDVAAFRYTHPADATGMSESYAAWRDSAAAASGDWVRHDPARANALLDAAGYARGPDGVRRLGDGKPWRWEVLCVSGWSDWVRASQVIARDLREVGVDATVRTYDFGAWFQRVQEGNFDLSLGWCIEGPTPWHMYRWLMSSATLKPVGQASAGNWHRYSSPAADSVLTVFETATDPAEQRRLSSAMQRLFVAEAPAIPLYPNPTWAEFNTRRFKGFPTAADPYCDPSPNKMERGEVLLVLTSLRPR